MRSRASAAALFVISLFLSSACPAAPERVESYTTRGLVRAVDGEGEDRRVAVQHEPIATFRDRDGERAPMGAMTMAFALTHALQATRLTPGEKIAIDFEMRWETRPPLLITRLTRLPAETALALSSDH